MLLKTEITGVEIRKAIAITNIVQGLKRLIALGSTFALAVDNLSHTPLIGTIFGENLSQKNTLL